MIIDVELEEWPGSPVIRARRSDYTPWPAAKFDDAPSRLTARQGVFCRNLIRVAVVLNTTEVPVHFELPNGHAVMLDRGCIKIAEHAGFIEPLENGPNGTVEFIRLAWRASNSPN
jgi:hypothetical protein